VYEPKNIGEFIGQVDVVKQVQTVLNSSKILDIPAPHMIFWGGAGLGKTALGKIISTEMGSKMIRCIGNTINPERELMMVEFKDVLFVDEIHRIKASVEETLYTPMDEWLLYLPKGIYDKGIPIYPFTLIGATTLLGKLSKPLRDRCMLNLHFQSYKPDDMVKIILQASEKTKLRINSESINLIALMSRGTPRIGLKILAMARNVMVERKKVDIDEEIVTDTMNLLGLQSDGLTFDDIRYMKLLFEVNRPIGNSSIAVTLGIDLRSVTDVIEPFLMENGYVILTDRGRMLTRKGVERIMEGRN
jgi:Holliday junction DNA helicase RuvB